MSCRWYSIAVAGLLAIGCNDTAKPETTTGNTAPVADEPAPEPKQDPEPPGEDETVKEHMDDHFGAVRSIQVALAHGNLDKAKERAAYLAEHPTHEVLDHWEPFVDMVRLRARSVADSADLPTAAKHTAKLGLACSECHLELTAIATFSWQEAPGSDADPKTHMKRHQWALDRMWEGLVGPSEMLWSTGAEVLTESALHAQALDTKATAPDAEVTRLAALVHELGNRAVGTELHSERAAIYAELLGTCSTCHGLARK